MKLKFTKLLSVLLALTLVAAMLPAGLITVRADEPTDNTIYISTADELLEFAEYVGNYYGTPLAPILEATEKGVDIVMDVDVVGALKIKKRLPGAVLVFIAAPSFDALRQRLVHRGDVSPEAMAERLERARWEYTQAHQYDYILLNEDVEQTAGELMAIMTAEKCKTMERIHLIKEEL